ncbi:MAG: helix-turn-helix domain-containing protein [Armatimonadetes bacterium]|nr:helix-turn-helix domain-containing protein [Armatimonadota bacterium]
MVSARGLSRRLGCKLHTVLQAIRKGELAAVKVGRTWAIAEDEKLARFEARLLRMEVTRKKRSATLKWLWRFDPERLRKPPRRKVRVVPKVMGLWLHPLPSHIAATETNSVLCPTCHNRFGFSARVEIVREEFTGN